MTPAAVRPYLAAMLFVATLGPAIVACQGGAEEPIPDIAGADDVGALAAEDARPPADSARSADAAADAVADTVPDAATDAPADTAGDTGTEDDTVADTGTGPAADTATDAAAPDIPPPPTEVLGLPLREDGVLYAGAAAVDITPDLDAGRPVFMGGFGHDRRAEAVRDPLWARAIVLSRDREYVAIVAVDLVGLTSWRVAQAADRLAVDGFAAERLVVQASHDHASPDTVGLWGPSRSETGLDADYQVRVTDAIAQAVREAAAAARPATFRVDSLRMRDVSPWFTSERFGGKKPGSGAQIGLVRDSRDPVVVNDTLTALGLFDEADRAIATVVHVNTHMEVAGSTRTLTSDFAHAARQTLETRFGGVGVVWVGAVGGLQTPLSVDLPATDETGAIRWETCDEAAVSDEGDPGCLGRDPGDLRRDADDDPRPLWVGDDRWERTDTYGRLLGALAGDLIESAAADPAPALDVRFAPLHVPLQNRFIEIAGLEQDPALLDPILAAVEQLYPEYVDMVLELKAAFAAAVLDFPPEWLVTDPDLCPLAGTARVPGCLPDGLWSVRLGALHLLTVPGELVPELAFGLPDDVGAERDEGTARGAASSYFRQHDADCDGVEWRQCRDAIAVGACDCRRFHAVPYELFPEPAQLPLADLLSGEHRIILGLTGEMGGYILPETDYLLIPTRPLDSIVSLGIYDLVEYASDTGDHYEESVSAGPAMASEIGRVATRLLADQNAPETVSGETSP